MPAYPGQRQFGLPTVVPYMDYGGKPEMDCQTVDIVAIILLSLGGVLVCKKASGWQNRKGSIWYGNAVA